MTVSFERKPHPHIAQRSVAKEKVGINGRIAIFLTGAVGTMCCAYAFAILSLVACPRPLSQAIRSRRADPLRPRRPGRARAADPRDLARRPDPQPRRQPGLRRHDPVWTTLDQA